jgi:hypothetical protein
MKNNLLILLLCFFVIFSGFQCKKSINQNSGCYKGRLEIQGICSNYTIKVLEGNIDTSLIVSTWKDPNTGKTYGNVFGLGSPCTFPATIKEGEEFYFTINNDLQNCAVCQAYYPTPPKKLSIAVTASPCK